MSELYSVLGLKPGATLDEVRQAYRRIALECHPDRTEDPQKLERFQVATQAYEVLSDPVAREEYESIRVNSIETLDVIGTVDTVGVIVAAAMGAAKARRAGKKIPKGSCKACLGAGELVLDLFLLSLARECPLCQGSGRESSSTTEKNTP